MLQIKANMSPYSLAQMIQMEACTNCRICADVCPAVLASLDGHLSGVYRLDKLKKTLYNRNGAFSRLFHRKENRVEDLQTFGETVFRCTLCGNCQQVCPAGIPLKEIWVCLREDLADHQASPRAVYKISENLAETHNVFAEDNEERADWVEDMEAPPEDLIKDKAEWVYFTGCVAAYFPLAQRIPVHFAQILNAGRVNLTLLGQEEYCCGFPLLSAGRKDEIQDLIRHNMEQVRQKGASGVIFACPTCYQMWREFYRPEFRLIHSTEMLYDLIQQKKISLNELPMTVTYHDPCDLGRGAGVFEAPREVIHSIPGIRLVELSANRENCLCCGGGGSLEMFDPKLAAEIAKHKIHQVLETGAQAVITACQQCVRTMTAHVRRNNITLEVLDLTELVHRAMKKQENKQG